MVHFLLATCNVCPWRAIPKPFAHNTAYDYWQLIGFGSKTFMNLRNLAAHTYPKIIVGSTPPPPPSFPGRHNFYSAVVNYSWTTIIDGSREERKEEVILSEVH